MAMLTWIPEVLRDAGLVVVEYDGWQTRMTRASGLEVMGVVCHHTATAPTTSNIAVARLLANGRSDLKGPLSQLGLDRDGHFWMIAAGRCNHNGYGKWGNDSIGIEAYNDGVGEPWPKAQLEAYERGCAALLTHVGLTPAECRGHKETDPGRKIDPRGIDMTAFRARVAEHMEDEDMSEIMNKLNELELRLIALQRTADKTAERCTAIYDKIVPTQTVRDDIKLNREIAAKVGVPAP